MALKHGLGRGLDALIKDGTGKKPDPSPEKNIPMIPVAAIKKNPFQPRRQFPDESIAELAASIKERGIVQPLLVRASDQGYELIAGERRLRAASLAGLKQVPAIIMEAADRDSLELALVENLQREDLNPLEEAEGYSLLSVKFNLTQEQVADRVGKARASVSNTMRLLLLPKEVRKMLSAGEISRGHAKALLAVEIEQEQLLLARRTATEGLSVRRLEKIIQRLKQASKKPRAFRTDIPREHLGYILEKLHTHFGTSVRLSPCRTFANGKKGKGSIEIDFFSNEDLDRILVLLGVNMD